VKCSTN